MSDGTLEKASWSASAVGRDVLWYCTAFLACLAVMLWNGTPLFYFDTNAYLTVGQKMIDNLLRLLPAMGDGEAASSGGAAAAKQVPVESSRSAVFSLLVGGFAAIGHLGAITLFNAALVLGAVWLMVRVAARQITPPLTVAPVVGLSLLVACLGSLPFYVAFLMPDIYAPLMILTFASLTAFSRQMHGWEVAAWVALGMLSVLAHSSHLAIAILMLPLSLMVSVLVSRRRWWLAPLLLLCITGTAIGQKVAFNAIVKTVSGRETFAMPFLTARMFQDGVTYRFLETRCDTPEFATCALYEILSQPGDPMRMTASHILFDRTPELGSLRLLDSSVQTAISREQYQLFKAELLAMPVETVRAFVKNTLIQARMNRVDMTLPDAGLVAKFAEVEGLASGPLRLGRLSEDTGWLGPVTAAQNILYAASTLVLLGLMVWPGALTGRMLALVGMVLMGILVNALVCGGISQPATRYGARVIWLLPLLATFCALYAGARRDVWVIR